MEYTVKSLAEISGISTRTLRYYDGIDLLKPARISSNGYRIYGQKQVDILQQILFYRELSFSLEEIKAVISSPEFNKEIALKNHLSALTAKKEQIEKLILNVSKTINSLKGDAIMSDKQKFEGFKKKALQENEEKYGEEIREKYGEAKIRDTNQKFLEMSEKDCENAKEFEKLYINSLKSAMKKDDPACEEAKKACDYHKQWLMHFWTSEMFTAEAHKALVEGYSTDERFKAFYEKIEVGFAEFFKKAIHEYYN